MRRASGASGGGSRRLARMSGMVTRYPVGICGYESIVPRRAVARH